jgi:hypothetical protein
VDKSQKIHLFQDHLTCIWLGDKLFLRFSSREVEGPALRNLGNHTHMLVPTPAETAQAGFLEDEVKGKPDLSIQRGFLINETFRLRDSNESYK